MAKAFSIPFVAFFGRNYEEYLAMFSLDESSLRGRSILDCPSGPDSFVAEGFKHGLNVIGCDPMYAMSLEQLCKSGKEHIDECFLQLQQTPDNFDHRDIDKFRKDKYDALESFAKDYLSGKETRYIDASIPNLPFADRSFDLVLSSHFLFCYAAVKDGGMLQSDIFDLDFHLKGITELARVTRSELRMTPTHSMQAPPRRHPYLDASVKHLESLGFAVTLEPSDYDDGFAPFVEILVGRR
ncbi:MAG: methyltransferase domain-containing protein [Planctomycetota bacterium]|nr:methyltransferase domain-containing protein [Planctomycetota bacterium]